MTGEVSGQAAPDVILSRAGAPGCAQIVYYSYMQSSLDLEHLRTLIAIAECGGFGKAAEARHISQPALSKHVRLLERGLKRKIFEKDGRGMKFTPEGERVLAEARQIILAHDEALDRLKVQRVETLAVGSTEHSAEQVLPQMLRALQHWFPGVTTRFEIARSTSLAESVTRGSVDLAFVLDHDGRGAGHEVGKLPLRWYSTQGWVHPKPGAPRPVVAFEEPCGMRERALRTLSEAGHRAEVVASSTSLEGVLAAVRAGLGLGLLPNAGARPAGLVDRPELPDASTTTLRLIARRGLPKHFEEAALQAGTQFFAAEPRLQLVAAE